MAAKHHVNSVIVTSSVLPDEKLKKLRELAEELELELRVWDPELTPVTQVETEQTFAPVSASKAPESPPLPGLADSASA